jgi:DNA-binding CsgD family transcriptional regulator
MDCGCKPGDLCPTHEEERKRYAYRQKRKRSRDSIIRHSERYNAKRKANPKPCSNCDEVKTIHLVSRQLCSACLMHERRYGMPRPKYTVPLGERLRTIAQERMRRKKGFAFTPAVIAELRQLAAQGMTRRQLAEHYGVSTGTVSCYANYNSSAEMRAAQRARRNAS